MHEKIDNRSVVLFWYLEFVHRGSPGDAEPGRYDMQTQQHYGPSYQHITKGIPVDIDPNYCKHRNNKQNANDDTTDDHVHHNINPGILPVRLHTDGHITLLDVPPRWNGNEDGKSEKEKQESAAVGNNMYATDDIEIYNCRTDGIGTM